jgi:hypothetical protein
MNCEKLVKFLDNNISLKGYKLIQYQKWVKKF